MKKIITVLFLVSSFAFGQNTWINEFHYDNSGGDVGEFIEVAVEDVASYDLSKFKVTLYNGSNGSTYSSETLNEFVTGSTDNNITLFTWEPSSIQNGAPDGFSLDYDGTVIQFLSYEGDFTATAGIANGMTSTDVGVSEGGSTNTGESLQLSGDGTQYSDFTWNSPAAETKGTPNNNQALPVELTTFSASVIDNNVELNWATATEVNNYGFNVERASAPLSMTSLKEWNKVGFVNGYGNSNSPKNYSFVDNTIIDAGKYFYRLKQVDIDGSYEYSSMVEVDLTTQLEYKLNQNFPNPFNPTTTISFSLPSVETGNLQSVRLTVFNVIGEQVAELINKNMEAGNHNVEFNASELNSGIYVYKIEANGFVQIRKMMLVK